MATKKQKAEYQKEYCRTKKGLVCKIYNNQVQNSRNREHPVPTYTQQELKEWLFSQQKFHELYNNYKQSNYDAELVPSVDRTDDYKGYSLDNIKLMTWEENRNKFHSDVRSGINTKHSIGVIQFNLKGVFIQNYHSIAFASRETGISSCKISRRCRGVKSRYGDEFLWKKII